MYLKRFCIVFFCTICPNTPSIPCISVHVFRYRHVMLPKDIAKLVPKNRLMTEMEWRSIGIQQSQGWVHYMFHGPGMMNW